MKKSKSAKSQKRTVFVKIVSITIAVLLIFAALIAGLIFAVNYYDNASRPQRLSDTINEHVPFKNMFTAAKVIKTHENDSFNFNGDEELGGTFQLKHSDIEQLLNYMKSNSWLLLNCSSDDPCAFQAPQLNADQPKIKEGDPAYTNVEYCNSGNKKNHDETFTVCIHTDTNQVDWSYDWY